MQRKELVDQKPISIGWKEMLKKDFNFDIGFNTWKDCDFVGAYSQNDNAYDEDEKIETFLDEEDDFKFYDKRS